MSEKPYIVNIIKNSPHILMPFGSIGGHLLIYINPIISSIILIFSGFIPYLFKIKSINFCDCECNQNQDLLLQIDKDKVKTVKLYALRLTSLIMILFGIFNFVYIYSIMPHVCEKLRLGIFYLFAMGIAFFYPLFSKGFCKWLIYIYDNYIYDKITRSISYINISYILYVLIFFINTGIYSNVGILLIPIYYFSFIGFPMMLSPNAFDIRRTKYSSLAIRVVGILFIIRNAIFFVNEHIHIININEFPWWLLSSVLMISCAIIIFAINNKLDPDYCEHMY